MFFVSDIWQSEAGQYYCRRLFCCDPMVFDETGNVDTDRIDLEEAHNNENMNDAEPQKSETADTIFQQKRSEEELAMLHEHGLDQEREKKEADLYLEEALQSDIWQV